MPDLTNWMMVFVRAGALLSVFPLFSTQPAPVQIRLALGALVAFLVAPSLPPTDVGSLHFLGLVGLFAVEAGIGLLLGIITRLIFYALEFAGSLVAMEMGLNLASTFNPLSRDRSEAAALVLFYLGAMLLLTLDLHHWILVGFQKSYGVAPVGGAHLSPALFVEIIGRTGEIFRAGLLMAAPVIAVSFLITLIFSVLSRAVPQMNVFYESFAFRTLGGLAVFGLTLNLMAQHVANYLRRLPDDLMRVAQLLGAG